VHHVVLDSGRRVHLADGGITQAFAQTQSTQAVSEDEASAQQHQRSAQGYTSGQLEQSQYATVMRIPDRSGRKQSREKLA
jgi:hypothetical protein